MYAFSIANTKIRIKPMHDINLGGYYYDLEDTVYILPKNNTKAALIHEITHAVMDNVFNNHAAPYFKDDNETRASYEDSIKDVLDNIAEYCPESTTTIWGIVPQISHYGGEMLLDLLTSTINTVFNPSRSLLKLFVTTLEFVGYIESGYVSPHWKSGTDLAKRVIYNYNLCNAKPAQKEILHFLNIYHYYEDNSEHSEAVARIPEYIIKNDDHNIEDVQKIFMPIQEFVEESVCTTHIRLPRKK